MRFVQKLTAVLMLGVTACWLFLSPPSGLHCFCRAAQPGDAAICHEHHCSCCGHENEPCELLAVCAIARNEFSLPETIQSSPCECPPGCPCHLRHAKQPVHLNTKSLAGRRSVAKQLPPADIFQTSFAEAAFHSLLLPARCVLPLSGSERCAMLCRFTI